MPGIFSHHLRNAAGKSEKINASTIIVPREIRMNSQIAAIAKMRKKKISPNPFAVGEHTLKLFLMVQILSYSRKKKVLPTLSKAFSFSLSL